MRVDLPGRFLLRNEGEPQAVQAHVAVGDEIGGFGLRAIPIILLLLFGGLVLAVTVAVRRQQAP